MFRLEEGSFSEVSQFLVTTEAGIWEAGVVAAASPAVFPWDPHDNFPKCSVNLMRFFWSFGLSLEHLMVSSKISTDKTVFQWLTDRSRFFSTHMSWLPTPGDATFLVWWSRKRLYFAGVQCWVLDSVNLELGDKRVKTQTPLWHLGSSKSVFLLDSVLTVKLFQILTVLSRDIICRQRSL